MFDMKSSTLFSRRTPRLASIGVMIVAAFAVLLLASCRQQSAQGKPEDVDYYTCTMHPSVRSQDPKGKCPICSMDLEPVMKKGMAGATGPTNQLDSSLEEQPTVFTVATNRQQQIGVTYATISRQSMRQTIRAIGVVAYDKQRHWDYVSRVEGYVKDLSVFSRGELVEKAAPLLTIYSPELVTTEKEFVDLVAMRDEAKAKGSQPLLESTERLVASAKERLRLWNIDPAEIAQLEKNRQPRETLTLYSPFRGVVQTLGVDQGRKVMPGDHLVDIADLSAVWVWAEFYENELSLLKRDLPVTITSSSYPGEKLPGKIAVVDPFINDAARVSRVRINVDNRDLKLRPDMYVNVELALDAGEGLAVPFDAILPTGTRNIAFVDRGGGKLEPRFVELGRKFGDFYAVNSGLKEGERVVTSANFLIDAEAKVQGALKSW